MKELGPGVWELTWPEVVDRHPKAAQEFVVWVKTMTYVPHDPEAWFFQHDTSMGFNMLQAWPTDDEDGSDVAEWFFPGSQVGPQFIERWEWGYH